MQATKDSFYVTLRDRLAQAYPGRTITVDGITRPAMVVVENDKPSVTSRQHDAFYLEWGDAQPVRPATNILMAVNCTISYSSAGTEQNGGLDRGRMAGELESELLGIFSPASTHKFDYTGEGDPSDLGTEIFWSHAAFRVTKAAPGCVAGQAGVTVYFYPEVSQ